MLLNLSALEEFRDNLSLIFFTTITDSSCREREREREGEKEREGEGEGEGEGEREKQILICLGKTITNKKKVKKEQ